MSQLSEQVIALGAVFEAATLVDKIARTGQISESNLSCMLGSLLSVNPSNTLEVYGGDDFNLHEGYRGLQAALNRAPQTMQREPLRYALGMIALERKLNKRTDMLDTIGQRLEQIQGQVEHFGLTHENVCAAFGGLYQDTLSTFSLRIQVHGEMQFLQQANTAAKIRALLLAGIRSARLWRQLGGNRWQLLFSRSKLLGEVNQRLHSA